MYWLVYIIIGIVIIFALLVMFGNREYKKRENENNLRLKKMEENAPKKVVSKTVNSPSFIDQRTGMIVLRSNNYATSGKAWFVCERNITIKHNHLDLSSEVFSFSEIHSIKVTGNTLSFSILDVDIILLTVIPVPTEKGTITFKAGDLAIAQAIHDRVIKK